MSNLTTLITRARRPHLFHTLVLVGLLAACNAAPGVSPSPTAAPSGTPSASGSPSPSSSPTGSPAPSPSPTATPTASPAASPTFGQGQIEHPTGATEIVLRWEQGGGFVPLEVNLTHVPQFTLYGDGTVVFQSNQPWSFGEPMPPMLTGRMTEEGIQALLQYALTTGGLATARDTYDHPGIADAGTDTFVLNANGEERVVQIYALFEAPDPSVPDRADRAKFAQLQNLLRNFETEANSGTVDDLAEYDAETYRVVMLEQMGGQPAGQPIDWPWDDVEMDDFPAGGDEPGRILHMTREQVAELLEVPSGGASGIWVTAPDDTLVQFAVRPLLPDEVEAAGL